jgi:lysophospholipase L1-like esterase
MMSPHRLAALALCALLAGPVAAEYKATKPQQRTEHWQRRQAEIGSALRTRADLASVKLLFVGDSITDFWLLADDPWVKSQRFGRSVWNESFAGTVPDNLALNIGISGDRTEHLLHRLLPAAQGGLGHLDAPALNPEFIVLMIGVNNSWDPEEPVVDSVFQGVKAVIDALRARRPGARIVLQSLLPTTEAARNGEVVRPVNERLSQLAASAPYAGHLAWLDLYPAFVDAKGQAVASYFADDVHPNEAGYRIWRDRLVPFLQRLRAAQPKGIGSGLTPVKAP